MGKERRALSILDRENHQDWLCRVRIAIESTEHESSKFSWYQEPPVLSNWTGQYINLWVIRGIRWCSSRRGRGGGDGATVATFSGYPSMLPILMVFPVEDGQDPALELLDKSGAQSQIGKVRESLSWCPLTPFVSEKSCPSQRT
ncbi:hypothetical protein E4U17_006402 [Claviceps sp. LM77 group G4]|nr:hypothetical protein E4U17_006402 [Claviceps sp. LM77 group G4]